MNAIAIVIISVVGLIFVILLISAILTIHDLERAKQNLKVDNLALSDALMKKSGPGKTGSLSLVDVLEEKIKRLEEGK